jgi:hypothetical protein
MFLAACRKRKVHVGHEYSSICMSENLIQRFVSLSLCRLTQRRVTSSSMELIFQSLGSMIYGCGSWDTSPCIFLFRSDTPDFRCSFHRYFFRNVFLRMLSDYVGCSTIFRDSQTQSGSIWFVNILSSPSHY